MPSPLDTDPTSTSEPSDGDVADPSFDGVGLIQRGTVDFFRTGFTSACDGQNARGEDISGGLLINVDFIREPL